MNLLPNAAESEIITTIRAQVAEWFPLDAATPELSPPQWRALVEHGWLSIGQPDGADLGVLGEVLLLREVGRGLVPGELPSTLLALRLAVEAQWSATAHDILAGTTRVGWAVPTDGGDLLVAGTDVTEAVVVDADGVALVTLQDKAGPELEPVDPSWPLRWATATTRRDAPDQTRARALAWTLVAAQASGVADATTQRSVAYAKTRTQFGQAIGAFQAVAHRCADMAVRAEVAWRQTAFAALSLDEHRPDALAQAASARLLAVDYAVDNAADNIQNHGGIGFTTELPEHRFVKRAHALRVLLADDESLVDTLLDAAGAPLEPSS
jgi:alkylation response protein AidB-like acyl-CoA dehydrogenase